MISDAQLNLKGYYIMKFFFQLASDIKIDEGESQESGIKTFLWPFIKEIFVVKVMLGDKLLVFLILSNYIVILIFWTV